MRENQQGSLSDPSETTRRAPFARKEILAYLNGAIHDATLNKGKRIRFAQKNKQWLKTLQRLLKSISCNSWIYKEGKNRKVYVLETLCKDLDFRFNSENLKNNKVKIFYLRGFFDAEGGIPHKKSGRFYIQLVQKDLGKIKMIKRLLADLRIKSGKIHNPSRKIDPDYWRIFILAENHKKFAKVINSFHPLKAKVFRERMKI
jgi:intein-encoded DNA endonuclease-like protein